MIQWINRRTEQDRESVAAAIKASYSAEDTAGRRAWTNPFRPPA